MQNWEECRWKGRVFRYGLQVERTRIPVRTAAFQFCFDRCGVSQFISSPLAAARLCAPNYSVSQFPRCSNNVVCVNITVEICVPCATGLHTFQVSSLLLTVSINRIVRKRGVCHFASMILQVYYGISCLLDCKCCIVLVY